MGPAHVRGGGAQTQRVDGCVGEAIRLQCHPAPHRRTPLPPRAPPSPQLSYDWLALPPQASPPHPFTTPRASLAAAELCLHHGGALRPRARHQLRHDDIDTLAHHAALHWHHRDRLPGLPHLFRHAAGGGVSPRRTERATTPPLTPPSPRRLSTPPSTDTKRHDQTPRPNATTKHHHQTPPPNTATKHHHQTPP